MQIALRMPVLLNKVKNPNKRAQKYIGPLPFLPMIILRCSIIMLPLSTRIVNPLPLVRISMHINNTQFRKVVPVIIIRQTEIR